MIGWVNDIHINDAYKLNAFNNINMIDTSVAFKDARGKIWYIIPAFIKYISGDRTKSKIYGQIKRFYPEELLFMERNIIEHNIDNIKNIDMLMEDSCTLSKDLRIVVIKDKLRLSSISGYEFISFTKGDNHINTLFIENREIDVKFTFSICLKLFDNIILSCLHNIGIPVNDSIIALNYNDNNLLDISKFIVDYMYELIYPFEKSLIVNKEEVTPIVNHIYNSNFKIIDSDIIEDLYELVHDTLHDKADDYDYIEFILDMTDKLESSHNVLHI